MKKKEAIEEGLLFRLGSPGMHRMLENVRIHASISGGLSIYWRGGQVGITGQDWPCTFRSIWRFSYPRCKVINRFRRHSMIDMGESLYCILLYGWKVNISIACTEKALERRWKGAGHQVLVTLLGKKKTKTKDFCSSI